ncbi:MAG: hypothetical protein FJ276_36370 [Planctomycetes bacterium]|nr:hypothetical protein [Planctomycetota bacterium]
MPGGDRTGPMGMGPMTGRGAGYCAGAVAPGDANRMPGGGFVGRGRGGGRGWRHRFYATGVPGWARQEVQGSDTATTADAPAAMSRQQELELLKQQAQQAADALEHLRQRINDLASESSP